MCFSATASFIAGGTLSAAGAVTLTRAKTANEFPFASVPLLFGLQQTIEGAVWLSFGSPFFHTIAIRAYVIFSHMVWPILTPVSVLLLETDPTRKKILRLFSWIGLAVGSYLLYFIITEPVTARIVNRSIAYHIVNVHPFITTALYFIVTCGSCLISSHRIVRFFGIALIVSSGIAAWLYTKTFFSVWCFFAAMLSTIVYAYFKRR